MAALSAGHAYSAPHHKQSPHQSAAAEAQHHKQGSAALETKVGTAAHEAGRASAVPLPKARPASADAVVFSLPPDAAASKQAIELVRHNKADDATRLAATIDNPAAQKLVEWMLLRQPESTARFDRYAAFIQANPEWPSIPLLRRRAEVRLWQERRDGATVRRFLDGAAPSRRMPATAENSSTTCRAKRGIPAMRCAGCIL